MWIPDQFLRNFLAARGVNVAALQHELDLININGALEKEAAKKSIGDGECPLADIYDSCTSHDGPQITGVSGFLALFI